MPRFSRRRFAAMLHDLNPQLTDRKYNDLIGRFESNPKYSSQAIGAEAELSVLWAFSRHVPIVIEPNVDGRFPEALASEIFPRRRTYIEVTALSDDGMSGEVEMRRAAELLCREADIIRRGSRRHLFFRFLERSGWGASGHFRERRVTKNFEMTNEVREDLRAWISGWPHSRNQPLRIDKEIIGVLIEYHAQTYAGHNFHSSMPAVTSSLTNNTLFSALTDKEGQLPRRSPETCNLIFLIDAGSSLLKSLHNKSWSTVSGQEIINHFLSRQSIDAVVVCSPKRDWHGLAPMNNPPRWHVMIYHQPSIDGPELARLKDVALELPLPRFEGYSARSRHRAGHFAPTVGQWRGTSWQYANGALTSVRISARLLLEILAGRQNSDILTVGSPGNEKNLFEAVISSGQIIRCAHIESGGPDEDDDHVVFEFDFDFSSTRLKKRPKT